MSSSTAELTLILKARNLAGGAINEIKTSLDGVVTHVKTSASKMAESFRTGFLGNLARDIGPGIGGVFSAIARGKDIPAAFATLGILAAGSFIEWFGPTMIEKLAASRVVAVIGGALTALGSAIGAFLSSAIAVGMAAFPFVLAGVLVGALVYLINNPEARQKVKDIALGIIGGIGDGLRNLGKVMADAFFRGLQLVFNTVKSWVKTIIAEILRIPGAVADAIRSLSPLQNTATYGLGNAPAKYGGPHAAGGWAGLNGPEMILVGERGPEYVRKAGTGTGDGGGGVPVEIPVILDGREVGRVVDRRLSLLLDRAAPGQGI